MSDTATAKTAAPKTAAPKTTGPKAAASAKKAAAVVAEAAPKRSGGGKAKKGEGATVRWKRHRHNGYGTFLYKVLKQVGPDTGITTGAMTTMRSFVADLFERVGSEAGKLARYNKRVTLGSREIQAATRLILPGELAKHATSEGAKAVMKYRGVDQTKKTTASGRQSRSARAGLVFPVSRVHRHLSENKYAQRTGQTAAVYLAAVLEYLAAEIFELAATAAANNKKKRIIERHIMLAVRKDKELDDLLGNVAIANAGVTPYINAALVPARRGKAGANAPQLAAAAMGH